MTPLDKLKQAAIEFCKPFVVEEPDEDVIVSDLVKFATSEAAREYWFDNFLVFMIWKEKYVSENLIPFGTNIEQLYQEFLKQKQK